MTPATAPPTTTGPVCPAHLVPMQLRHGRAGDFFGCPEYPACRETVPVGLPGITCPQCGRPVVERIAKKSGKPFWPCGRRDCAFIAWERPHRCAACEAGCFGGEREQPGAAPDAAPDPAIPARADDEVSFRC